MTESVILVPLDGTVQSRAALPVADALAHVLHGSLHVIHVDARSQPLPALSERLGLLSAGLRGWSIDARGGDPADAIVDAARARRARLAVMCAHTADARPMGGLGRTVSAVLQRIPCPLVLVQPGQRLEAWHPRRILVPHDGSMAADAAVKPAAEFARTGSEILAVQVGTFGVSGRGHSDALAVSRYMDQPQHEWPIWGGELLDRIAGLCPEDDLHARVYVRCGDPAKEIVKLAQEEHVDLVLLAWKGDWGPAHAKTIKTLVSEAPCPMMMVRA